jgi:hypothetical protein
VNQDWSEALASERQNRRNRKGTETRSGRPIRIPSAGLERFPHQTPKTLSNSNAQHHSLSHSPALGLSTPNFLLARPPLPALKE